MDGNIASLKFLLSDFLNDNIELEFKKIGVFNPILIKDSNYFINVFLLRDTEIIEFKNSYSKILKHFRQILILLDSANTLNEDDVYYQEAYRLFDYPEINQINLGYSSGEHGAGIGPKYKKEILSNMKDLIEKGKIYPELFFLVGIFNAGIGPDRLSDMIGNIILEDIKRYTIRINKELKINKNNYPEINFNSEGIMKNPYYEKRDIFLLPKSILHKLNTDDYWENIDDFIEHNINYRKNFSFEIMDDWKKQNTYKKKELAKNIFQEKNQIVKSIISEFNDTKITEYDFESDEVGDVISTYYAKEIVNSIKQTDFMGLERYIEHGSYDICKKLCEHFKDVIENNSMSRLFYNDDKSVRNESAVQNAFFLSSIAICKIYNLDLSPEVDSGRGPVDFKTSRGNDKTIIEIKLTSNQKLVHGWESQIEEYSKAERIENRIYLVIDNGEGKNRLDRLLKIEETRKNELRKGERLPKIIIIDGKVKKSASIYKDEDKYR